MNGTMKQTNRKSFDVYERCETFNMNQIERKMDDGTDLVAENCKGAGFSLAAVAGMLLMCAGIILYTLLTL